MTEPESAVSLARDILSPHWWTPGPGISAKMLAHLVIAEADARRADVQAIKAWRDGGMWDVDLAPCLAAIDRLAAHQGDQ